MIAHASNNILRIEGFPGGSARYNWPIDDPLLGFLSSILKCKLQGLMFPQKVCMLSPGLQF